jgi:hypothetical protein
MRRSTDASVVALLDAGLYKDLTPLADGAWSVLDAETP